jgi:glycosyltransferase involved in cell wall biosynthesis
MNIVQITAGAGGMYCGICLRDNALVAALRKMGHHVLMVPLYLPLTLDEKDESDGVPIFFSGINVYLEQKSEWFRGAPAWFHSLMTSRRLLKWAGGRAARTQPGELGDITLSMLRGEEGFQRRELEQLIGWLKQQGPVEVICLSNALLIGLARKLKSELGAPVTCMLQGEDVFLDSLPERYRQDCWKTLSERAFDVAMFGAASRYFGEMMARRLELPREKMRLVYNGINLQGFDAGTRGSRTDGPPVLGYFARMCSDKGLDTLVEAFIILRKRGKLPDLRLKVGGGSGPSDEAFVRPLKARLKAEGLEGATEFHPNLDRAAKVDFLRSLSVFSVPAKYGEAFGMYVIEALAGGVPVVEPRAGAFTELIESTGGGVLCEPGNAQSLAEAIESVLVSPDRGRALGEAGRQAVQEKFSANAMALAMVDLCKAAIGKSLVNLSEIPQMK